MTQSNTDLSNVAGILGLLKENEPTYEESCYRADRYGLDAANAYTAGYWRAIQVIRTANEEVLDRSPQGDDLAPDRARNCAGGIPPASDETQQGGER